MLRRSSADDPFLTANGYVLAATRAVARDRPVPEPPDGAPWAELAQAHGVLPALLAALAEQGSIDPPAARAARLSLLAHRDRVARDLGWLADQFRAAGLRWLIAKGPVLAWQLYRRPGSRWFGDLDALVAPNDFGPAVDALEAAGACLLDHNWDAARRLRVAELTLRLPLGTPLDLHWHLVNRPRRRADFRLSTAGVLSRACPVELNGVEVLTLDGPDTIGHLCLHGALGGGHLLRWLLDLHQALSRLRPEPAELRTRTREQGLELLARVMLERAADYLDPRLREWADPLAPGALWPVVARTWSRHFPPAPEQGSRLSGQALLKTLSSGTGSSLRTLAADTLEVGQLARLARSALHRDATRPARRTPATRLGTADRAARAGYLADIRHQS